MFRAAARKLFGSANDRRIRSYQPRVSAINALEKDLEKLSDDVSIPKFRLRAAN